MQRFLFSILLTVFVSGCGGDDDEGSWAYAGWYNVYGEHCGNTTTAYGPGCNYYYSDHHKGGTLLKATWEVSPYNRNNAYFFATYGTWNYQDSYGVARTYIGFAFKDPGGVLFDEWGSALNEKVSIGRDQVGDVGEKESQTLNAVSEEFAQKYDLSLETSRHVIVTLHDWAMIGKSRARTTDDIAGFSERLYGINVNEVKLSLQKAKEGDMSALEQAARTAASNWGTTPETFKEIQKSWFGRELAGEGLL